MIQTINEKRESPDGIIPSSLTSEELDAMSVHAIAKANNQEIDYVAKVAIVGVAATVAGTVATNVLTLSALSRLEKKVSKITSVSNRLIKSQPLK